MPFIYPTSAEMRQLEPDLVLRDRAGRLGLEFMPVRNVNAAKVRWQIQDNYRGLQQLRGLDGAPTHVNRVGKGTYEYEPGVFGEFVDITETELVTRAGSVDVAATPVDVQDLVVDADRQLVQREDDRIESSIWAVLTTGTISIKIAGPNGTQVGYTDTYPVQTFNATVGWATVATATPFADMLAMSLLGVGSSTSFGGGARFIVNSTTAQYPLQNRNAADLNGRLVGGGNTINSTEDINRIFVSNNLARMEVYDAGYLNDSGTFVRFVPTNVGVLIGARPGGENIGNYVMTRNANNNFRPGSYRYVKDHSNGGGAGGGNAERRTPANIEIHRGHSGGPAIYRATAVVVADLS